MKKRVHAYKGYEKEEKLASILIYIAIFLLVFNAIISLTVKTKIAETFTQATGMNAEAIRMSVIAFSLAWLVLALLLFYISSGFRRKKLGWKWLLVLAIVILISARVESAVLVAIAAFFMKKNNMKIENIELEWLGHAAFRIIFEDKVIYLDPYQLVKSDDANVIFATHPHYDHCSIEDIEKISKNGTIIFCPADAQSKIARIKKRIHLELIEPNQEKEIHGIKVKTIESYNPNKKFHPKAEAWLGYVLQFNKTIVYHAGDTDNIREMSKLTGYSKKGNTFIALLPVGGTYTMNAEEAMQAASIIKPTLAIPMHYGSVVGSRKDAEQFRDLCSRQGIQCQILEKS